MEKRLIEDDFISALASEFPDHVSVEESAVLIGIEIVFDALDRAQQLGLRLAGLDGFRSDPDGLYPMLDFIVDLSPLIEQRAPLSEQYDSARKILRNWGEGPDLVELVLLEP
ncbi:hypothetical protein OVA06_13730 [Pseudarthrobacter sp. SL88]|uniref:hypothetical protein n=1 Tax=Pseudarthrobacter sp. SL88 TaxID=2994666 RepID=UPI0022746E02|nr:hypothetical protein [Pseudarthrobacter sp. SL88]MCY1675754.1 hypothetical protein [Pseudarthrobacter sp. SL88]